MSVETISRGKVAKSQRVASSAALLEVAELQIIHRRQRASVTLVDGVSFSVARGEIFGLVGESGSGKSITALAAIRLLGEGISATGSVVFEGRDLTGLSEAEMRDVRGGKISMIFQEPIAALNPVFTIGSQIVAAIRAHAKVGKADAHRRAVDLLRKVGIPDSDSRMAFYPHQLSGGMCQRVMIAMALAAGARLVIADEPTTALDVTIQAEIVKLLQQLVRETGVGLLFISHDLGLVSEICDRVAVVYAGEIVETGATSALLRKPLHPYMQGLLRCAAHLDDVGKVRGGIPGVPPSPGTWPQGCRFQARCSFATAGCEQRQELREVEPGHLVRCWRAGQLPESNPA
jgi:oligopeptide/dipeptide ABC transporter ATP-binding protein